jgi:hypothetical protein
MKEFDYGECFMRRNAIALAMLVLLCTTTTVSAAQFCVGDEAGLREAFDDAQATAEPDEIRIRVGTITLTDSLSFSAAEGSTGALIVSGGWDPNCAAQQVGAQWTTIDTVTPQVGVWIAPDDDLTVRDMAFVNMPQGVGLSNQVQGPQVTTLKVSRVAIFNDEFVGDDLLAFFGRRIS